MKSCNKKEYDFFFKKHKRQIRIIYISIAIILIAIMVLITEIIEILGSIIVLAVMLVLFLKAEKIANKINSKF